MPGFDRSGPMGNGPMSGRGSGRCNPVNRGMASQFGRGKGLGGRVGLKHGYRSRFEPLMDAGTPYNWYCLNPSDKTGEIDMLKAEAISMKNAIETIERRIGELVKGSVENPK